MIGSKSVLSVTSLSKSFGGRRIFDGVTFDLERGHLTTLYGENGSGKTTLFNVISGFVKPSSGSVRLMSTELTNLRTWEISRLGVGKVWQVPRIFEELTVEENLLISRKGHAGERLINYVLAYKTIQESESAALSDSTRLLNELGLASVREKTAIQLTLGERRLLNIGMLLMNDASIFLIDEPFSGLGVSKIAQLSELLVNLKLKGKTVFIIEHKIQYARSIADSGYAIIDGCMRREL